MSKQQLALQDRILDKALEQAEATSWEQLHLHAVAEALNITLDDRNQVVRVVEIRTVLRISTFQVFCPLEILFASSSKQPAL